jgi:ubiquinone/menaquinone biosynthesis C-methylase UbiE
MIRKYINKIKSKLGLRVIHGSETAKVRKMVLPFCHGFGCDVGFGGDKIKKENCLGIDYATPYASAGRDKVDVAVDLHKDLIPLPDNHFDYLYTSHLIEDFQDTGRLLNEFVRLIKPGGNLILVFPDQKVFEEVCARTGQALNPFHVHADMGFNYMKKEMGKIPAQTELIFSSNCEIDYNVVMVYRIINK